MVKLGTRETTRRCGPTGTGMPRASFTWVGLSLMNHHKLGEFRPMLTGGLSGDKAQNFLAAETDLNSP